uniref:leucine--tRNA ligase n=1 Tax=Neospora caninum (strain Liverpool) TaxID=572307 RepID=A0A0F7UE43_NEOCL|nr:TPA: leucyl-tRNA synthetase, putative [Neospora caninum Liverpool]
MRGAPRVHVGGKPLLVFLLVSFWTRNICETNGRVLGAGLGTVDSSLSPSKWLGHRNGRWWTPLRIASSTWSRSVTSSSIKCASGRKRTPSWARAAIPDFAIEELGAEPIWPSSPSRAFLFPHRGNACRGCGVQLNRFRGRRGPYAFPTLSTNERRFLIAASVRADRKLSPFITCRSPSPPPLEAPSPSLSSSAVGLYPFKEIESKWSRYYAENAGDFSPPLPGQGDAEQSRRVSDARLPTLEARPFAGLPSPDEKGTQPSSTEAFPSFQERRKFYILSMIPYPSGEGLHVGHSLTYTIADVVARYQRLRLRGELVKSREKTDQSRCAAATRNNISVLPSAAARATNGVGSGHQPAESPLTELSGSLESTSHQETRSAHESRAQPFRPVRTSIRDALDQGVKQEAHVTCAAENAPGEEAPAAVPECASRARETPPHPDVLHVMGWDSFGLPAEQHAVASGISPCLSVRRNIDRFRQQLQRLGVCVDWRREVNTSSPEFYRWTQWIVVQMMKRGLVYEKLANVNWCEDLGTVLANEEVIDGFSERGGFPVTSRMLRQWHLRITAYADQLLAGLETLDWPADVKRMQRNWIGRRDVLLLDLAVSDCRDGVKARNETHRHGQERSGFKGNCVGSAVVPKRLRCVATSPELIFGVTFVVIHSSHPAASVLARTPSSRDCSTKKATGGKMVSGKEELSEGYFAGVEVDHPLIPAKKLPVWISDSLFTQLHGFGGLYNEMDALLVAPESEPRAREFAQQRGIDVAHILDVNGETKKSFQVDKPSEVKRFEVDQRTSKGGEPNENAGGDVSPNSGASGEQDTGYSGEGIESSRAAHIAEGYGRVEPPPSCSSNFLEAKLVNSSAEGILSLNGKNLGCARQEVIRFFTEKHKRGCREVRYAMRDWLFSRQRFWGEPIPLVRGRVQGEASHVFPVNEADLPVLLPEELPLKGAKKDPKEELVARQDDQTTTETEARDFALRLSATPTSEESTACKRDGKSETHRRTSSRTNPSTLLTHDEATAATLAPLYSLPQWWNVTLAVEQVDGVKMASSVKANTQDALGTRTASSGEEGNGEVPRAFSLQRETSTMPQWAGSSWYFFRFLDPHNTREPFAREAARFWMPVDMYVGGKEHAVTHLLYARFWHKVLRDLGRVACDEPFQHLVTPGVILGSPKYFMFKRQDTGEIVSSETVELMDKANLTREQSESGALAAPGGSSTKSRKRFHLPSQAPGASQEMLIGVHTPSGQPVYGVEVPASAVDVSPKGVSVLKNNADVKLHRRHEKMSKSRGNVVSPDTVIDIYGADSLRLYLLFMGPLEARKNWNTSGVVGAFRFLNRVWNLLVSDEDSSLEKEGNCCSTGTATADNSMPSDSTGGTSKKLKLRNSPPSSFERELMKSLVGRVTADIERMSLNTAIAALMAHVRKLTAWAATGNQLSVGTAIGLVRLLHPFAPFVTEELWQMIHSSFQDASPYSSAPSLLASATWPTPAQETGQQRPRSGQVTASESAVESINFSIHVDGKLQGTVQVPRNSVHDEEKVSALAKRCPCLKKWEILQKSGERGFAKTVFIPARRIINFVT